MNTAEIHNALTSDPRVSPQFVGVFACDTLPRAVNVPAAIVVNTHPASKAGEHWIAMYIAADGSAEYVDSYGRPPVKNEFVKFLEKNSHSYDWNDKKLQAPLTSVCGQYCIFYILCRCRDIPMRDIMECFTDDRVQNDELVCAFVNTTFKIDTEVVDDTFILNQLASVLQE